MVNLETTSRGREQKKAGESAENLRGAVIEARTGPDQSLGGWAPRGSKFCFVPSDLPAVPQKMTLSPTAPCVQAYKWISESICLRLGVIKRMYFGAKYNKQSAQTFSGLLISQGKRELGRVIGKEARQGVLRPQTLHRPSSFLSFWGTRWKS